MSQEDYPADSILESIDTRMPTSNQPKVLLFDIGGVCVVSPFQAILNYELSHNIPPGWVNASISFSKPNGYWQRLERGELELNPSWFDGFNKDLQSPELWTKFYTAASLKDSSLPTFPPLIPSIDGETLFWDMMLSSRAPDPWMWPALQVLKRSKRYILAALSNTIVFPAIYDSKLVTDHDDVRGIFDIFVSSAHVGMRKPNEDIYLYTLKEVGRFAKENAKARDRLDWESGVQANEILFLDDIGENLKMGKQVGLQTIKVHLGKAFEAVDTLEDVTGLQLAGDHPRLPIKPVIKKPGKAGLAKL